VAGTPVSFFPERRPRAETNIGGDAPTLVDVCWSRSQAANCNWGWTYLAQGSRWKADYNRDL